MHRCTIFLKYLLLISIAFTAAAAAHAQTKKVVFIRPFNYALEFYTHKLKKYDADGKGLVGRLPIGSALVYKYNGETPEFYFANDREGGITPNGNIAFVMVTLGSRAGFIKTYNMDVLSQDEFIAYYNEHKWLRRNLEKSGYDALSDIFNY